MKIVNIVYAYMREPRFEIPLADRDALVVWTRKEEVGADVVVYHSGYSYDAKRAVGNPSAFRVLYTYEPLVVYPRQFLSSFWTPFDVVLTWNTTLVEQGGKFIYFPSLYYDFPFGSAHGVVGDATYPLSWREKKKAICQVAGNKHSLVSSELYSHRRRTARWFSAKGQLDLDTYGVPPMPVPNYRGRAADKCETLSAYRFALCFENDAHPLWSRGYVTEKIFDCFYAFTLPVYLGAADVETVIPADCFVDFRDFSSLSALDAYLINMSDEEFERRLIAIEQFLKHHNAPLKNSCFQLYEKVLDLADIPDVFSSDSTPVGFWQRASWMEKLRAGMMMIALPVYKKICGTRYAGSR
jgi:hypothetical protein